MFERKSDSGNFFRLTTARAHSYQGPETSGQFPFSFRISSCCLQLLHHNGFLHSSVGEVFAGIDFSSLINIEEPARWTFEGGRPEVSSKTYEERRRSPRRYGRPLTDDSPYPKRHQQSVRASEDLQAGPSQPSHLEATSVDEEATSEDNEEGQASQDEDASMHGSQDSQGNVSYSRFPDISAEILEEVRWHHGDLQVDDVDAPLGESSGGPTLSDAAFLEAVRREVRQSSHPSSSPVSVGGKVIFRITPRTFWFLQSG